MQFGINLPNNQGVAKVDDLVALAQLAEQQGFASVWVSEHLFHTAYVEQRIGNAPYHEALTLLTAVATRTQRIRLGTSVLVLPWHHPVRLAKIAASLDQLSAGRLTLGVGVGTAEDEYAALGMNFKLRGRIANETLAAMQELWTNPERPRFEGRFYRFGGLRFAPKPLQLPLPVWVGGSSDAALERAAKYGTGWHPLSASPKEVAAGVEVLRQLTDRRLDVAVRVMVNVVDAPWDRPVQDRRTARGTVDELVELFTAYRSAGVTHVIADANTPDLSAVRQMMSTLAEHIQPRLR